jgi:hypothetical protein
MNRLNILLLYGLYFHESHIWPAHRFTDGLGIMRIVLVTFDVGRDELGWDQLDLKAPFREPPGPVMGTSAGFHPYFTACRYRGAYRFDPLISAQLPFP